MSVRYVGLLVGFVLLLPLLAMPALAGSPDGAGRAPSYVTEPALTGAKLDFTEAYVYTYAPEVSETSTVADFDGDGRPDVALVLTSGPPWTSRLLMLHNLGNWEFSTNPIEDTLSSSTYIFDIDSADFDGDGWIDLLFQTGGYGYVLLNDQTGGFTTSPIAFAPAGYTSTLADMNADGRIDILIGKQTESGGRVSVFLNDGSSFTQAWESPFIGRSNGSMNRVVAGHLTDDAIPDIVATEVYSGVLTTYVGAGGGVNFTQVMSQTQGARVYGLAGGNANGDELTDIAFSTNNTLWVHTADGAGAYTPWWSTAIGNGLETTWYDFNSDGFDDLVHGAFMEGALAIYLNRPASGDFWPAWSHVLPGMVYGNTVADMNSDGYADLVVRSDSALRMFQFVHSISLPLIMRS